MKLYCKIKKDGKWSWYVGDSSWKIEVAKQLCECRVCKPKSNNVCPECNGSYCFRAVCSNNQNQPLKPEELHANCSNDPCDCPGVNES